MLKHLVACGFLCAGLLVMSLAIVPANGAGSLNAAPDSFCGACTQHSNCGEGWKCCKSNCKGGKKKCLKVATCP